MEKQSKGLDLQWKILIGIVAGIGIGMGINMAMGAGITSGPLYVMKTVFQYGGDIFIRLLRMLIVPLVFASIFMAVANLGDVRALGKIGGKTVGYYMLTTALAVLVGLIVVNMIDPGIGIDKDALAALNIGTEVPDKVSRQGVGERNAALIIVDTFVNMIPKNAAAAFATGDILQIIFFTIFLAIMASTIGRDSEELTNTIHGIDRIMQKGIMAIMVIAPYAIFMLVTAIFMDLGFAALKALGKYAATVIIGLFIHGFVTLPILVLLMGRYNPYRLFKALSPAMMTAWSTASSAATLPMTMSNLENRAGVEGRIGNFVLPLGATINMDGTALYESVAVIFIAQIMGIELTIGMQVVIFVTASLAAIGAAAIPGAGLVTMGIVLTAAGLPLDGIGLILAIDRILDQFRTAINVWGDATAAVVIGHSENAIHEV
ncbi:ethanolamine utilization protein EutD [Desulfosarcina ovata subsp. sediminis]|uniref:Ethanolamine utilization protein EutD n=1 Tax=Desulfosarcina ovata subsp. sediminis TaxID=885957 RepID=A0A5K7ZXX5_9BACT|nr:dicarboxylate/amino acid:cation symporter [Desulfosarcina ovata]BBO84961.1 ethanolamine utilization protein EutD [Desulfosarcina ovata subsp. sediminis]